MHILGISAYHHDSAAALLRDGELVAAAQEERFTRIKHDAAFPANAVRRYPDPLFWDTVHTNETGVQLIARQAWPALQQAIG
jgi:predicted NodU family carbamoyl transferase